MRTFTLSLLLGMLLAAPAAALAQEDDRDRRIRQLEETVQKLEDEVTGRNGSGTTGAEESDLEERIRVLEEEMESSGRSWTDRLTLGGYGEMHLNFVDGGDGDTLDYHRWVLYLGYEFSDWVKFTTELEVEHSFVADDSGGELVFEQLHFDFLLTDAANVRAGRFLTPIGIVNQKHEPTSFNGVERPFFDKYIIPTTWSSDGVGLFGNLGQQVKYQAYVTAGLDGSQFDATNGIRGGRMKERPGLNAPAVTGRVDWYPLATSAVTAGQTLRLGASGWYGGIDNGNKGQSPGVGDSLTILSGDFEYSISRFDFRGVVAWERIDGAEEIGNNTAEEIFGWYLEGAVHLWPEGWKEGKLSGMDLVFFVRYEWFDTQWRMPDGVTADPRGRREAVTAGFGWFILPNLVAKVDYQWLDDDTPEGLDNLFNIGLGWAF